MALVAWKDYRRTFLPWLPDPDYSSEDSEVELMYGSKVSNWRDNVVGVGSDRWFFEQEDFCHKCIWSSRREPRAVSLERATLRGRPKELRDVSPPRQRRKAVASHTQRTERPPCGPGPPLKQLRSQSVDNCSPGGSGNSARSRQRSVSGNVGPKKHSVRRLDEEAVKRSRFHANQYELSQDLLDKQVEMLERKYGGIKARNAALTIQRAFRKHCMQKRFLDITNASKGEKRLSRRIHTLDLENTEWGVNGVSPLTDQKMGFQELKESGDSAKAEPAVRPGTRQGMPLQRVDSVEGELTDSVESYEEMCSSQVTKHGSWPTAKRCHIKTSQATSESSEVVSNSFSGKDSSESELLHTVISHSVHTCHSVSTRRHEHNTVVLSQQQHHPRKIPPQVPKRTSSIPCRATSPVCPADNLGSDGSTLESSITSSDSQSSPQNMTDSPIWKRKSLVLSEQSPQSLRVDDKRLSNISENSEDSLEGPGYCSSPPASDVLLLYPDPNIRTPSDAPLSPPGYKLPELQRKRQYRVGLNLFNKKPERGIRYLIQRGFLEAKPQAVARFLVSRKGLSKQMIGEYLGNLQCPFNMAVLECFVQELDLAGMQVDVALRKFQTYFRLPGEAQKIERLVEVFSRHYVECNHDIVSKFRSADTVFVLAFAIIMLNTDLHTPSIKAEKKMKLEDFIKNLRGVDEGHNLDRDMLVGIYERIRSNEFKPGSDHVTQVLKVQHTIVGKKPNLALPHRRLVCYCRLYEVFDVNKKERPGVHQREVFLFNDMLMVTKIFSKKKNSVTYTFRQSIPLCGMNVTLFEAPYYPHGIRLSQRVDDKVLITFNARNEHDRCKFVEDLKESILEMDEMENLRIEAELEKQKSLRGWGLENRDSGVADIEILPSSSNENKLPLDGPSPGLKRSALSNSLLDLHDQQLAKPVRRGSAGSLDSGMSVSFQSSAASTVSRDSSPQTVPSVTIQRNDSSGSDASHKQSSHYQGFLGGLFGKRGRTGSKGNVRRNVDSSEV